MRNKFSTLWLQATPTEEKEEFSSYILSQWDNRCLMRLRDIVVTKRIALEASERNPEMYKDAAWAYLQAHNNGARQALKTIEDLLAFVK